MEYLLEHLEELVTVTSEAIHDGAFVLSEKEQGSILQDALQETDKIRSELVAQVFRFAKEKEIELFIQNYQGALTQLLNRLYSQEEGLAHPDQVERAFFEAFYQPILGLLSFIEERFSKYFDKNVPAPAIYLALIRTEIRDKLEALPELIVSYGGDGVLAAQLVNGLRSFVDKPAPGTVTYKDLIYRKKLIRELEDISSWANRNNLYPSLTQLLIYLNYNDKQFINYFVNQLAQELNGREDGHDKIDQLLLYSKVLNQLQFKPDSALHGKHPSVKTQLNNWIAEELYYLEKKMGLLPGPIPAGTAPVSGTKQKVMCMASVDQLGVFFRAAADIELITSPSQRALFEQITPFLSTPHKKGLSADSMRSKSYSPEKKDVEAVKDLLMQLFKKITQY